MKKKSTENKEQTLKRRLREFDQLLAETRRQVREAREKGPAFQIELEERLGQAQAAQAAVRKKISSAKAHSKKRKREIDEWKLWYQGVAKLEKSAELQQLNQEIAWRAADIAAKEAEIGGLYLELLQAEGDCEQLSLQLAALAERPWDAPVDEDPRIKSLAEERERIKTAIAQLK